MGLFSRRKSKEEKHDEKTNQKKLDYQFNRLVEGASIHVINILEDSKNKIFGKSMIMYVHSDGTTYLNYIQPGSISKYVNEFTPYTVISFEWLEDIQLKGKKVLGRSIIGLSIAGPAGMIVGGLSGKNKTKDESTAILILQNSETKEIRTFSIKCNKNQMRSFKLIPTTSLVESTNIFSSPIEQLKEFKELLDLEIINQEEYDTKKAKLLNL